MSDDIGSYNGPILRDYGGDIYKLRSQTHRDRIADKARARDEIDDVYTLEQYSSKVLSSITKHLPGIPRMGTWFVVETHLEQGQELKKIVEEVTERDL